MMEPSVPSLGLGAPFNWNTLANWYTLAAQPYFFYME